MALPLPNLDDRTYQDLMEEARALIPTYDPSWTNHNPTDPGITLIELFAWLVEMLIFRVNRVTDQHLITFLKLLNGPEWTPGRVLSDDIRDCLVALRQRYRAVTPEDYERLAKEATPDDSEPVPDVVARAKCIPRQNLDAGTESDRTKTKPGHVSVIIVPSVPDSAQQPSTNLLKTVWDYLEERRTLTTWHHVVGPIYAPISAEILIACQSDVTDAPITPGTSSSAVDELRERIVEALENFLHPLKGGPDGEGWPFGRGIYVSELYKLLENIDGVDYVPDITLSSQCTAGMTRCVNATELWHEEGDLIGLDLKAHHLPMAEIDSARIIIAAVFIPVQVDLQVGSTVAPATTPATLRRAVKTAVKYLFHPLHDGSTDWKKTPRSVTVNEIISKVQGLDEVDEVTTISLQSDPNRLILDSDGVHIVGVRIEAREIADVRVEISL